MVFGILKAKLWLVLRQVINESMGNSWGRRELLHKKNILYHSGPELSKKLSRKESLGNGGMSSYKWKLFRV